MKMPNQCEGCPVANFLYETYVEASHHESLAMTIEADALVSDEVEVAKIASSALDKIVKRRKLADKGLESITDCPGYTTDCGKGLHV